MRKNDSYIFPNLLYLKTSPRLDSIYFGKTWFLNEYYIMSYACKMLGSLEMIIKREDR